MRIEWTWATRCFAVTMLQITVPSFMWSETPHGRSCSLRPNLSTTTSQRVISPRKKGEKPSTNLVVDEKKTHIQSKNLEKLIINPNNVTLSRLTARPLSLDPGPSLVFARGRASAPALPPIHETQASAFLSSKKNDINKFNFDRDL